MDMRNHLSEWQQTPARRAMTRALGRALLRRQTSCGLRRGAKGQAGEGKAAGQSTTADTGRRKANPGGHTPDTTPLSGEAGGGGAAFLTGETAGGEPAEKKAGTRAQARPARTAQASMARGV